MKKAEIVGAYKELPTWAKGIVAVGVLGGIFILAFSISKWVKKSKENKDLRDWEDEKKQLQKKFTPSFSDAQYTAYANQVYESVKYAVGDDYGLVVSIMKNMKNDLDVATLVEKYGKRQRYTFGIPQGDPIDLFTTIQAELGQEYGGLTNYRIGQINTDWKAKGITYQV